MSFNRIYGVGSSPSQALIYSKMNEIECGTKTDFLSVTKTYTVKKPDGIDVDDLELKIIISALEDPNTRNNNKHFIFLKNFYGREKLDRILDTYKKKMERLFVSDVKVLILIAGV